MFICIIQLPKPNEDKSSVKAKKKIKQIALDGTILVRELAEQRLGNFYLHYSPESFPGTEVNYAFDIWQPTPEHTAIINMPTTVEYALPQIFASQVEYIHKHLNLREAVTASVHPQNDREYGK